MFGDLFDILVENIKAVSLFLRDSLLNLPLAGSVEGLFIIFIVTWLLYYVLQSALYLAQHSIQLFQSSLKIVSILLRIIAVLCAIMFVLAIVSKYLDPHRQCSSKIQEYFTPCKPIPAKKTIAKNKENKDKKKPMKQPCKESSIKNKCV